MYLCRVMESEISKYKGIHPGKIISWELKNRKISQREFARQLGEHNQSINAVIVGRRSLTPELSVKVDKAFDFEEGFLLTLQAYYSVEKNKNQEENVSVTGSPNIRKILFWDTNFDKMEWGRYRNAVIQRVLEQGSEDEIAEIARFYKMNVLELKKHKASNAYRIRTHKNK